MMATSLCAVRSLTAADRTLFLTMSREFYASPAVMHDVDAAFHERTFDEMMRSDVYAEGFLLSYDGVDCGFGLLSKTFSREAGGMVVWLEELYIRPAYRGKGLGSFFFRFVEENRPAARYRLEVEPENTNAVRLYERLGYTALPYAQMIKEKKR